MRLNKGEREEFRKRVKILIPKMKKSEIVNHFKIEGYSRQTIYNTINRVQLGGAINEKKKTDCPTSWTPARNNQLKRLINKVRGCQFGHLCKRMRRATLAFFHPRVSPRLKLYFLA